MKKIMYLLVAIVFATACKKETVTPAVPDCEKNQTAILVVTNNSKDVYQIYVSNQDMGLLDGGKGLKVSNIKEGDVAFKAVQKTGYIIWPTIVEKTLSLFSCKEYTLVVP